MSAYYSDKLSSLRDIFGTEAISLEPTCVTVADRRYPIVDDVIVLLDLDQYPPTLRDRLGIAPVNKLPSKEVFAEDIQSTFGDEWKIFHEILPGHETEFHNYFDLVDLKALGGLRVCDLGCGIGRWSYYLKDMCREMVLVDFSEAIFVARKNLGTCPSALFFMGNLRELPFRPGFADFLFCLGVLHHLPTNALEEVRGLKKYSSAILIYLYYALDNRPAYFRWLLSMVTSIRLITSSIRSKPFRSTFTWLVACFVYVPMIWLGHVLAPIGLSRYVPLYLGYKGTTVGRIRQDVYDRFFTRIEQRFSHAQIDRLDDTYSEVVVSPRGPYWHFLCQMKDSNDGVSIAADSAALLRQPLAESVDATSGRRRWSRWAAFSGVLLCLLVALLYATNVPTRLTSDDITVFEADLGLGNFPRPQSFEEEIRTIRTIQARVFAKAPLGEGIPEYEPREPSDLMKYGRGLCYDRSRTLDKALAYVGFKTRHVFLLYRTDFSLLGSLVRRGHPSHAVTEVKTSRGWLYVDSNQPWIAMSRDGQPYGAGGIWKRFDEFDRAPEYVRGPWWAIRGLYSRKGAFYEPFFPLPQLNWLDFLEWVIVR